MLRKITKKPSLSVSSTVPFVGNDGDVALPGYGGGGSRSKVLFDLLVNSTLASTMLMTALLSVSLPTSDKSLMGKSLIGRSSTGKSSTGKSSTGKSSIGKSLTGKSSTGKLSTGKSSTGKLLTVALPISSIKTSVVVVAIDVDETVGLSVVVLTDASVEIVGNEDVDLIDVLVVEDDGLA